MIPGLALEAGEGAVGNIGAAGIDHDVDLAETVAGGGGEGFHGVGIGGVGNVVIEGEIFGGKGIAEAAEAVLAARGGHDADAFAGEEDGGLESDAGGGANHEGSLIAEGHGPRITGLP